MPSPTLDAALAQHRAGMLQQAEDGYRDCLENGESAAGPMLAVLLLQQSRHAEAAAILAPLSAADPGNADLAVNLSLALRNTGRAQDAFDAAQRASTLAPRRVSSWNALGLAALQLDRAADALAAFEAGLALAPDNMALGLHRAQCLPRLGRNEDAIDAFSRLTTLDPTLLDAWRGLGSVQSRLGQAQAALRSRERALQLAPQHRDVLFEHGIALMQAGNSAAAQQRFEQLLQADAGADSNIGDAATWTWLGRAYLKQDDIAQARHAFEQARTRDPHDPVIAHFQAAIAGTLPAEVESDYIRGLFDDFADRFEDTLVQKLAYATPSRLAQFIAEHAATSFDTVLDLGCGTGLMAVELARPGVQIDGVDLSPRMLAHARAKGVYRELHAAEIIAFLQASGERWDLIVAADVFVYVADLPPVFDAVLAHLPAGGCFAFSVEHSATDSTELLPSTGRFRHAPARIEVELADAGFTRIARVGCELRRESGAPVAGELILAWRDAA